MKEYLKLGMVLIIVSGTSFWLGKESVETYIPPVEEEFFIEPTEISSFRLEGLFGDRLKVSLQGSGNIIVNEESILEGEGSYDISLAKLPTQNDLELQKFPYTGNAKSMKFYNSNTYHARGVEIKHRRFFQNAEEAKGAGFIPSKNLK